MRVGRHLRWRATAALAGLTALVAACEPALPKLQPIASNTGQYTPGRIVWVDLLTPSLEGSKAFYGPLFDWTFQTGADGSSATILRGDIPVGGMIGHDQEGDDPTAIWLSSLSVENVDKATAGAASALGKTVVKPQPAPDRGRVSVVVDSENAPIALLRSSTGDPKPRPARVGEILWADFWTNDPTAAARFYHRVAGLDVASVREPDGTRKRVLRRDDTIVGGLVDLPWKDVEPNWLPYVRVSDVAATARHAASLGGKVLLQGKNVGILQDPQGAAIGIQAREEKRP